MHAPVQRSDPLRASCQAVRTGISTRLGSKLDQETGASSRDGRAALSRGNATSDVVLISTR